MLSPERIVLEVDPVEQGDAHSCLPASVLAVLSYWQKRGRFKYGLPTLASLSDAMGTTLIGTNEEGIASLNNSYLAGYGLRLASGALKDISDLRDSLLQGNPPIVLMELQSLYSESRDKSVVHAVVVTGYDTTSAKSKTVYLMDPLIGGIELDMMDFHAKWGEEFRRMLWLEYAKDRQMGLLRWVSKEGSP